MMRNQKEPIEVNKDELVEIPLDNKPASPSPQKEGEPAYQNAEEAFKALLNETVIEALSKTYSPPMNILRAFLDAFCENGGFSWIRTAKLAGAVAIGGLATIFTINPSGEAAKTLQNALKEKTGVDLSWHDLITRLFQAASLSEGAALGTFSGLNLIETYLGHASPAEKYLKFQSATCAETSKKIGRKVFDLLCAAAANVPTFFLTRSSGTALALLTAIANTSISWLGVSRLPLLPANIHPARRIETAYLNEQLETFLKLSSDEQNAILDDIDTIRRNTVSSEDMHKAVYARLLNLAQPSAKDVNAGIAVQDKHDPSTPEKALAIALGLYCTTGQINYTEATYSGISNLFSNSSSPIAITSGTVAAAFSVLPNVGFGYFSGNGIANALTGDNEPLARLYMRKTREALKYTIDIISMFAGGVNFTVSLNAANEYATLTHMGTTLRSILQVMEGTVGYTGSGMIYAYYTQRLCDEVLCFLALRCGDAKIKRLFTFVMETRRLNQVLSETSEENYLALLRWKMQGFTPLSDLMHSIFDSQMSEAQYNRMRNDLNTSGIIVRDRFSLPHYRRVESFFEKETEAWKRQHPGLRRRFCNVFCPRDGARDIESHGIEMKTRHSPA